MQEKRQFFARENKILQLIFHARLLYNQNENDPLCGIPKFL
jgi:hypothetical protein